MGDSGVGFNPYSRIRRGRNTRSGDIAFVLFFLVLVAALVVWAVS